MFYNLFFVVGAMEHKNKKYLCKVPIQIYSIIYFVPTKGAPKFGDGNNKKKYNNNNNKKFTQKYLLHCFVGAFTNSLRSTVLSMKQKKGILLEHQQWKIYLTVLR